ncbi:MAG: NAD(P)/FAD-dependent oxidoreductase, partial [Alphaproteobacteria bacterium]|nr:NAD(P)/FAD-dependent oxidoreductase [Alphaproteobacteria bacterium]
ASLLGGGVVQVMEPEGKRHLKARNIILASGSRPRELDCAAVDGKRVWNYANALAPKSIPASLVVVGGGAIGMEFSGFYHAMGCKVTLIEQASRVLPSCDPEISDFMMKVRTDQGMRFLMDSSVQKVENTAFGVCVHVLGKDKSITKVKAKKVLIACGVQGNTDGLGLENTSVEITRGHIKTDKFCLSDDPSIFVVGDAADAPWLAHKAQAEARICVQNMAGVKGVKPLNRSLIPQYTYSHPKVAMIGLSQQDAQNIGMKTIVGRAEFKTNTSALIAGNGMGFVKLVFNAQTQVLVGAFAISSEVGEVLSACIPCLHKKATIKDMSEMMFAYPMYAEVVSLAVADAARNAAGQNTKAKKVKKG